MYYIYRTPKDYVFMSDKASDVDEQDELLLKTDDIEEAEAFMERLS